MLRLAQYRTWDALAELRPSWNALLASSASDTVFLTWQWSEAWWKNYAAGREIFVLAVWEENKLVGVAPFYREEVRRFGCNWARLRLIGDGSHDSDYPDCFAQRGREAEVVAVFAGFLASSRESWDWIEINGPAQDSPCASILIQCVKERHWKFASESIPCATLRLPRVWEDYLRRLEPRFRTKVRSALTLLDKYVKSSPAQCGSQAEIDAWLPELFDLHTQRWGSEGQPGVFRDAAKREFYSDLSRAALEQGWLAFHRLSWGERPLALQYGLLYRNRFHLLQEGYDPAFSTIRPGAALRAWLMRHWIESGLDEYDFLAGAAAHKLTWGAEQKLSSRVLISASRPGALVAVDLPNFQMETREKLGRMTPAKVLSIRRKILANSDRRISTASDSNSARHERGVRRAARKLSAVVYSSVAGKVGQTIATKYIWSRASLKSLPARRTRKVLHIFQYHRVNDDGDPYLGGLPVESFRAQMSHLAKTFPVVALDQVARHEFSTPHEYSVAVTFDDGYRDNFVCAFPIMKELGIRATIFLTTGYVDADQLPWYDQVRLAFKLTTRSRLSIEDLGGPCGALSDLTERLRTLDITLGWLRGLSESERQAALGGIYRALGVASDLNLPNQMLRWDEIRQMAKHNISFGAHTVRHPVLSRIPATELHREIAGSKKTIENRLQAPVVHFAYPFGQATDFNAEVKQAVRDAGFQTAVTTIWGLNEADEDPLELKRFTPWETDPAEFKMKLDWYRFREPSRMIATKAARAAMSPMTQEAGI